MRWPILIFMVIMSYGCSYSDDDLANDCTAIWSNHMNSKLNGNGFTYNFINSGYEKRGEALILKADMEMTVLETGAMTYKESFIRLRCRRDGDQVYAQPI